MGKRKKTHSKIPIEINNLHFGEFGANSSKPKTESIFTVVFVVAEFDFDNHLSVGPKLDFWREGSKPKFFENFGHWYQFIELQNGLKPKFKITHLCTFCKILKFQPPPRHFGPNLGLKTKNSHLFTLLDFIPTS